MLVIDQLDVVAGLDFSPNVGRDKDDLGADLDPVLSLAVGVGRYVDIALTSALGTY